MIDKNRLISYLYRWIRLSQNGVSIKELFQERGIPKCAVYGYSKLTECLIYELNKSDIEISFIIDQNADNIVISFPKYTLDNAPLNEVQNILIMPVDDYEIIKKNIMIKLKNFEINDAHLITFEELIYEL